MLGQARRQNLPHSLQTGGRPADILISILPAPFWTSDFYNRKIIRVLCFRPLNLWKFVTTSIENEYAL